MIKRICRVSGKEFEITAEDLEFYAKMGVITEEERDKLRSREISVDEVIGLPTLCPDERQRRRLSWRNERKLYSRKCDLCDKNIISIYDKKSEFPVYCQDCWWSDKWDALDYGKDFDFSRDFFSQFAELQKKVSGLSLVVLNSENSEYNNYALDCKNAYMSFRVEGEDILYSYLAVHNCVDVVDCYNIENSELCYEVIDAKNCYEVVFSRNVENCSQSGYLFNCKNCKNCMFSSNLRGKQYYFCNKKFSKEEYEKIEKELNNDIKKKLHYVDLFFDFIKKDKVPYIWGSRFENCVGNHLVQAKDCKNCFDCWDVEDLKHSCGHSKGNDSVDTDYYFHGGNSVEAISVMDSSYLYFCYGIWSHSSEVYYSFSCTNNCQNLFGCIGLKHKKYCILNKQYSKEEYFKLREKIIEHMKKTPLKDLNGKVTQGVEWGEFFPAKLSPFAYNETVAQEYFPLTKAEAEKRGYKWKEEKINENYEKLRGNFSWEEVPDDINEVEDSICEKILFCERSGKPYKIQKAELRFYRKMNLPIPRLHPDERHKDRMKLRNPRTLFERTCADCGKEIQTTFAPDRPEKVLCEKCYLLQVN